MDHRMNVNENNPVTHVTGSFGIPVTHARACVRVTPITKPSVTCVTHPTLARANAPLWPSPSGAVEGDRT